MNHVSFTLRILYLLVNVVHHSVHHTTHTMGDVTFTDCTIGGFAGPGGSIGTASAISQLQPPSRSEGMSSNNV